MKNYYRIMLGKKSIYADDAYKLGIIGAGWLNDYDLNGKLEDNWKVFNQKTIPIYLEKNPTKTKVSAGLACGMLHTITKGISIGDIVLCPDGIGNYFIGEVTGDYYFYGGEILPHRRTVNWLQNKIARDDMTEELKNSSGSIGTVSNISKYAEQIERLISGNRPLTIISSDTTIEDPSVFALEKHLEDFLIKNWHHTELGKHYDIFQEDGEIVGQQYPSDTGPIDILAVSKDKKELVVVELKKGRASDIVVGQIQRYMGYVKEELAEENQVVRGIIIAFEDDVRIQRALSVTHNIEFYTYKVSFKLEKNK